MSGTSLEVSCTGADQDLIFPDHALAASPADAAVGIHDDGAALHEDVNQTFLQSLAVYLLAGRNHQEADMVGYLTSL